MRRWLLALVFLAGCWTPRPPAREVVGPPRWKTHVVQPKPACTLLCERCRREWKRVLGKGVKGVR